MANDIKVIDSKARKYVAEVEGSKKREQRWRETATKIVQIYECEDGEKFPFNILYANTELLQPSIYSQLPVPIVKRRFNDEDALGKAAAEVAERLISYTVNNTDPKYNPVDELIKSAVLDALVPGRGVTKVKYDAEIVDGNVAYESICCEEVPWDRFTFGYAKKWKDVPWISFEHFLTEDEVIKLLQDKNDPSKKVVIPEDLRFEAASEALKAENVEGKDTLADGAESLHLAQVYEIWDKKNKKVIFVSPGCDEVLQELDDPLELQGFYPIPEPLMMFKRISGLKPQVLYETYSQQAAELNNITVRIRKIMAALKVRGFYDASIEKIGELFNQDDNVLLAAENVANLEGKGLDHAIWLMPLNDLVNVLQQLYRQRQEIQGVIFQITGLSDVFRGDTKASETLGAQNLKSQFGSVRLKKFQKAVVRYAADLFRLIGELAVSSLSQQTIVAMTGLSYPTNDEKQQAQVMLQQVQMGIQDPNQVPPEVQQQVAQVQEMLAKPSWEDLIGMLKDDLTRAYKVEIETNSSIEIEVSDDKAEIGEFLNAMAQFMNGVVPLVQAKAIPFEAVKAMMLAVVRRYRFGEKVENEFNKMTEPQPEGNAEAEAQAQQMQMKAQQEEQKHQLAMKKGEQDLQLQQAEIQAKMQKMQMELAMAEAEHKARLQELDRNTQLSFAKMQHQMAKMTMEKKQNASV